MINRKLITRLAWTQRGVNEFEALINDHMSRGWEPVSIEIDRSGFRAMCFALLALPTHCECECGCCTGEVQHNEDCRCACDCCLIHSDQCIKEPMED